VFKGYHKWNRKYGVWEENEWLTDIYESALEAKRAVAQWGEGASFDNGRELQITRYYGKRPDIFNLGIEKKKGEPGICEKAWLRYAEFEIKRSDDQK